MYGMHSALIYDRTYASLMYEEMTSMLCPIAVTGPANAQVLGLTDAAKTADAQVAKILNGKG